MGIGADLIEADANKQNSTPNEDWDAARIDLNDASRAVREYRDTLVEAGDLWVGECHVTALDKPSQRQPTRASTA